MAPKLLDERPRLELRRVRLEGHSRGVDDIFRGRAQRDTGRNRPLHAKLIRNHQKCSLGCWHDAADSLQRLLVAAGADEVEPSQELAIPGQRPEQVLDPWICRLAHDDDQYTCIAGCDVQRLMQCCEAREGLLRCRKLSTTRVKCQPAPKIIDESDRIEMRRQRRKILARWGDDPVLYVTYHHRTVLDLQCSVLDRLATIQANADEALQDLSHGRLGEDTLLQLSVRQSPDPRNVLDSR